MCVCAISSFVVQKLFEIARKTKWQEIVEHNLRAYCICFFIQCSAVFKISLRISEAKLRANVILPVLNISYHFKAKYKQNLLKVIFNVRVSFVQFPPVQFKQLEYWLEDIIFNCDKLRTFSQTNRKSKNCEQVCKS